jgi:hypothetical protein
MAMQTDVMAKSLAASGTVFGGRTRVRGALVEPGTGAGSVVFKDGGASGATLFSINTIANGEPFSVVIPASGVLFETDAYAVLTDAKVTVFYG